jgi:enterochelin esterase-like enzyme
MSKWFVLLILLATACSATAQSQATPESSRGSTAVAQSPTILTPVSPPASKVGQLSCQGPSQMSDVTIPSVALGQAVPVRLYLPPCPPADSSGFPVIYLLHGANADETQWDDVEVDEAADAGRAQGTLPPVILVFPRRTDDSVTPRPDGDLPYEHFIIAELIPWVEQHTPARPERADRAIGGISRGGFWALEIAFHHPGLFGSVGGHSPAIGGRNNTLSPLALLAADPAALRDLRVWLDVGDDDSLKTSTADLATRLAAANVSVTFEHWPGAHNRPYWRMHAPDYLAFYTAPWQEPGSQG